MIEPPRKTRVVWSAGLWSFLSMMTVFDTSGNAIGYPVFFGFVLTYMRFPDARGLRVVMGLELARPLALGSCGSGLQRSSCLMLGIRDG